MRPAEDNRRIPLPASDPRRARQIPAPSALPEATPRRRLLHGLAALTSGLLLSTSLPAASLRPGNHTNDSNGKEPPPHGTWPQKALRLIVPTAPGTPPDRVARALAEPMGRLLGQSVIPENRPGNHGNLAATLVARSPADGYTLLLGTGTMPAINALLPGRNTFDPGEQLLGINRIATAPFLLLIGAQSRFRSLGTLLRQARREALGYGCHGAGSASHLAVEWLRQKTRAQRLAFHDFASPQKLLGALADGDISLACLPAHQLPLVQQEARIRIIALTSRDGSNLFPGVPGIRRVSNSLPDEFLDWAGLFAPRRTPGTLLSRLDDTLRHTLQSPQLASALQPLGFTPSPLASAEAFQQDFLAGLARNRALISTLDLKTEH